jgi:Reverse transcriptase (RNA-dependent DNA polymerase)
VNPIEPMPTILAHPGRSIRFASVPRSAGGMRTIAVLGAEDARAYAGAVARVVPAIEGGLGRCVFADRASVVGPEVRLGDWRRARRSFREAIRAQLDAVASPVVFVGDVRACFPSIQAHVVARSLRRLDARPADVERLCAMLRWFQVRGVAGLPVGPIPSAPLANAVLSAVDEAIGAHGIRYLRWVDDVVAVCEDMSTASGVADAFRAALAQEGLQANPSKTMIITEPGRAARHLLGAGGYSPTACSRAMLRAP